MEGGIDGKGSQWGIGKARKGSELRNVIVGSRRGSREIPASPVGESVYHQSPLRASIEKPKLPEPLNLPPLGDDAHSDLMRALLSPTASAMPTKSGSQTAGAPTSVRLPPPLAKLPPPLVQTETTEKEHPKELPPSLAAILSPKGPHGGPTINFAALAAEASKKANATKSPLPLKAKPPPLQWVTNTHTTSSPQPVPNNSLPTDPKRACSPTFAAAVPSTSTYSSKKEERNEQHGGTTLQPLPIGECVIAEAAEIHYVVEESLASDMAIVADIYDEDEERAIIEEYQQVFGVPLQAEEEELPEEKENETVAHVSIQVNEDTSNPLNKSSATVYRMFDSVPPSFHSELEEPSKPTDNPTTVPLPTKDSDSPQTEEVTIESFLERIGLGRHKEYFSATGMTLPTFLTLIRDDLLLLNLPNKDVDVLANELEKFAKEEQRKKQEWLKAMREQSLKAIRRRDTLGEKDRPAATEKPQPILPPISKVTPLSPRNTTAPTPSQYTLDIGDQWLRVRQRKLSTPPRVLAPKSRGSLLNLNNTSEAEKETQDTPSPSAENAMQQLASNSSSFYKYFGAIPDNVDTSNDN